MLPDLPYVQETSIEWQGPLGRYTITRVVGGWVVHWANNPGYLGVLEVYGEVYFDYKSTGPPEVKARAKSLAEVVTAYWV